MQNNISPLQAYADWLQVRDTLAMMRPGQLSGRLNLLMHDSPKQGCHASLDFACAGLV